MLSELETSICEQIDHNKDEIAGFLQALVRCPSITPGEGEKASGDGFQRHQAIVVRLLKDLNYAVESWEIDAATLPDFPGCGVDHAKDLSNMPVVTGAKHGSGGGRSLILNGHYDVVPVGDESYWTYPPFAAEIADGKIYGRGTNDMKGGIAAMLQALRILYESGVILKGDITVQVVPEEEATSMGTLAACQHSQPKADAAIIPEPTGMNILVAMRGNTSGSITVYGRAGHADSAVQPHWSEGGAVNAIYKAVKIIQGLEELTRDWSTRPEKQHKYLNPDMVMPTVIHGGDWIIKYPEKVEIQYDACHIPATKDLTAEIIEKVNAIAGTDPWMKAHPPSVVAHNPLYGAEVNEDDPIIQLVREVSHDLGLQPALIGTDSLTDAIHLINYARIPAISIGPSDERAHKVDEYLEIDELILHTKLLALAIMRWCGIANGNY